MIAVTAPAGSIGRHLLRRLGELGAPIRALARDPSRVERGDRLEVVAVDLDRAETVEPALRGADRLFLVAPGPDVAAQDAGLIAAAGRAGVRHVVMVSSLGVDLGGVAGGEVHMAGEELLRASGLDWTILRPSEFMSNALWWRASIARGAIAAPAGAGRIGFIDPADIAAVAAVALTAERLVGTVCRLTGPAALGMADLASELSRVLGAAIRYVEPSDAEYRQGALASGTPPPVVEMLLRYYAVVREGRVAMLTDDVERITGRPPRAFAAWLEDNAAAFAPATSSPAG